MYFVALFFETIIQTMRILQITSKIPYPPKDGGAIATYNLTKGFFHLGHQITVLSLNTNKHHINPDKIIVKNQDFHIIKSNFSSNSLCNDKINLIAVDCNTDIKPVKALANLLFSRKPYNAVRFISNALHHTIKKLLSSKDIRFDVIQLEGLYLVPYISVLRKYSKAIVALRAHNVEHEIWQRTYYQETNKVKKAYLKILTRRIKRMEQVMLNSYDVLVPITHRDAKVFQQLGNYKPLHVSPTGIDHTTTETSNHSNLQQNEFPSVFYIGALDWTPNQEGLIWFVDCVWKRITKKYPMLNFYIAGRNAPQWLAERIQCNNVVFEGEVENAKAFMLSKGIMVVPLFAGSGMRIKIIEGMALGKTIITTSIGTEGIDSTNHENIMIANSADEYISAVEKLINDKPLYFTIGRNAIQYIKRHFDNSKITASLVNFYKTAIENKQNG